MKGKMMKMKSCEAVNLDDNRISKMKIVSCEQRTAKSSGKIAAMNQNGSESHRKELNQTRGVEKENKPPIGKVLSQFANTIVEQVKGFMKEQQQQQQQQRNESSESKRPRRRSSATNANKSNNLISGGSSAQLISRVENKKSLPISASSTDITGKVGGSKKSPNDNLAKNSLHKSDNDNDDDEISKKMKKKRSKSGSEQSVARKKTNRKSSLTEAIQNLRGVASVDDVAVKVERSDQNRSKKRGKNRRSKRKSAGFNPNAHYDYDPIELEVVEMKTMLKAGGGKLIHRVYARSLSRLSPTGDFAKNNNNNNSNSVSRKKKGSVKSSGSKKRKKKKKKSKKKKRGKTNRKSCRKSGPGAPQKSSSISGRVAARNKQSKTAVVAVVEKQDRKIAGKKSPTFGGDDRTNLVMKQNDASGQNGGGGKRSK